LSARRNKPLRTQVLTSAQEFAALEEEWEELYHDSPLATPFQSWAWLYSWWESYGEGHELRLVTVRNSEGLLVGVMPLMLERWWKFGRLLFIGGDLITPYKDVLIRERWESTVVEAGVEALKHMNDWQVADFQEIRPTSAALKLFQRWEGYQSRVWKLNYLVIDVKPWDDLLASLSQSQRRHPRRTLRQAKADGVRCSTASPAAAEQAAHRLVALHRELRHGRDIDLDHLTPRFESLVVRAARRMTMRGFGEIYEFWQAGKVLVAGFMVFGKEFDGAYLVGASQKALKRYQWSSLALWYTVSTACSRGSRYLSLMDGEQEYKTRWTSNRVPDYRVIIGQRKLPWIAYIAYFVLEGTARQYLRADDTPGWLKSLARARRTLRARVRTLRANRFR
jgi:hypothetical protein